MRGLAGAEEQVELAEAVVVVAEPAESPPWFLVMHTCRR